MIFDKFRTDASQSYHRIGDLWKQISLSQTLKVAIATLLPFRTQSISADELLKDDDKIICKTLSNGFTYYIRPNDYLSKNEAYIRLVVKVGYLDEKKEELGIAHLVERLLQVRTKSYAKGEINRYLSSKGVLWRSANNAETNDDFTEYHIKLPVQDPEVLDKTLHIFSEMAFQAELLDQYIHHKKEVVCDELRRGQSARQRYYTKFNKFLFQGTPWADKSYVYTSTDEIDNVRKCPPQIIRNFYKKWYQPQNMALTVVGDINSEKLEHSIQKYFSSVPRGKTQAAKHHCRLPSPSRPQFLCFTDKESPLSQGEIYYKLPPVPVNQTTSVQEVKVQLMDHLLKLIINRRFGEMLSFAGNYFVQAGVTMPVILKGNPTLRVAFTAKEGAILQSFKALMIELKRLKEHGIDFKEYLKAKDTYSIAFDHLLEESEKVENTTFSQICQNHFDQSDSLTHPDKIIEAKSKQLNNITFEDLSARMQYLLQHNNCHAGIVQPEKEGLQVVCEADLKNVLEEVKKEQVSPYEYTVIETPLLKHQPKPGKIVDTVFNPVSGVTKYTLENGITVFAKHTTYLNNSIQFNGYALRGIRDTEMKDRCSAEFCERFFEACGLGDFSQFELKKILSDKTVTYSSSIGDYQTNINLVSSRKDLDTAFQILYTLFTNPGYSKEAFDTALTNWKETLQNKHLVPKIAFKEEIDRTNTQNHPEFQPMTLEKLQYIDYETCKKIHKDFYANSSDFVFMIVGNYSETKLKEYLEQYLASLPTDGKKRERLTFPPVPFPKGITYRQVEGQNDLPNAHSLMTFPTTVGDLQLEECLSSLCTKIVHERLINNLRLKFGITYLPHCSFEGTPLPGLHTSFPQTSKILLISQEDTIKDLEEATIRQLQHLQQYGPKDQEIEDSKSEIIKKLDKQLESNSGWLNHIYSSSKWNLDIEKINQDQALLKSITPEMIKEHLTKLYPLDNYTMVSLIPGKKRTQT